MSYLPGCTFPRRLSPTKLIFILIVSIVIAIQLIIVNDIEDWNRNSPRDASRYIWSKRDQIYQFYAYLSLGPYARQPG